VPWRVDQHDLVVACEVVGDPRPRPAGLREAVHQDEAWPACAESLGVEVHAAKIGR
jgi:hypothetical protein